MAKLQVTCSSRKAIQDTHCPVFALDHPPPIHTNYASGTEVLGTPRKWEATPSFQQGSQQVHGASCDLPSTNLTESSCAQKSSVAPYHLSWEASPHFGTWAFMAQMLPASPDSSSITSSLKPTSPTPLWQHRATCLLLLPLLYPSHMSSLCLENPLLSKSAWPATLRPQATGPAQTSPFENELSLTFPEGYAPFPDSHTAPRTHKSSNDTVTSLRTLGCDSRIFAFSSFLLAPRTVLGTEQMLSLSLAEWINKRHTEAGRKREWTLRVLRRARESILSRRCLCSIRDGHERRS